MKNVILSKTDLAQAYSPYIDPRSALNKLMSLINSSPELLSRLENMGYRCRNKHFTPKQVEIIIDSLGNPF